MRWISTEPALFIAYCACSYNVRVLWAPTAVVEDKRRWQFGVQSVQLTSSLKHAQPQTGATTMVNSVAPFLLAKRTLHTSLQLESACPRGCLLDVGSKIRR